MRSILGSADTKERGLGLWGFFVLLGLPLLLILLTGCTPGPQQGAEAGVTTTLSQIEEKISALERSVATKQELEALRQELRLLIQSSARVEAEATEGIRSQPPQATEDVTVYVTRTGKKYHRAGCQYLARSMIPMKLSDAKSLYGPCSVCRPP